MNKRRLEAVAKKLDALPRERFDYGQWVDHSWKGNPDLPCGASACALGWATTIPALRKAGLRLSRKREPILGAFYAYVHIVGHRKTRNECGQLDKLLTSINAAAKIFDISVPEAAYLFIPASVYRNRPAANASAKRVAKHIREFIKRGGIPNAMKEELENAL